MSLKIKIKIGDAIITIITVIFIVLKFLKIINWSWIWVFSPLWISFGIGLFIIFIIFLYTLFKILRQNRKLKKLMNKKEQN